MRYAILPFSFLLLIPLTVLAQTDWSTYNTDKFMMKYPSDWHISHVDTGVDRASVIFTSGYGPTVTVSAVVAQNYTISSMISYLQKTGFTIAQMDNSTYFLSNHHATRVIGSLDSVPGVEAWMLIAKIGDLLYSISYTDSYKDLYTTLPTVQEMINSFQGQSK